MSSFHEPSSPAKFDITVSVVSYNTAELLRVCLNALLARQQEGEATLQIIVADNGSTDGSVEMIRNEYSNNVAAENPTVELIETGSNLGYGRANNRAFKNAQGRYFCALNSDAEVQPGALSALRNFLDCHPAAGAAGPQLLWPDGKPQESWGDDPHLSGIFWEQTFLGAFRGAVRRLLFGRLQKRGDNCVQLLDEPRQVDQINGACLFARREAYAQVGGFNEIFFMYVEDVDINIRLRAAGWDVFFVPQARVKHHLGASSRDWRARARMVASYNKSRYFFFGRENARRANIVKFFVVLGALLRLLGWSFLALSRPAAREKIKLFREVLRQSWKMKL